MKRIVVCLSAMLMVFCVILGCSQQIKPEIAAPTESFTPTNPTAPDQSDVKNTTDTSKYIVQTLLYQIYEEGLGIYRYSIGTNSHILVEDVKTGTVPQIEDKGNGILKLHLGFGTNAFTVQYFDVWNAVTSAQFQPYTIYADYVDAENKEYYFAYFKPEEKPKLYIEGFFDSAAFSVQLDLNFAMATCEKLIFLNESEIYIEYTDKDLGKTRSVVNFREPANSDDLVQSDFKNLYERFLANEIVSFDETNAKKHFRDYLLWDVDTEAYTYSYLDMTGDGVPELCVRQYPQMYFFTVNNGYISHWYTEDNSYIKLLNNGDLLFERHGGAPTHINYEYYELDENATITRKATFSWWDGATIELGKVYPDVYIFEDKEVTKEEYEEKTNSYLSIGTDKIIWYDMDGNPE